MCLVSYIPLEGGYILSSNRDEFVDRNAVELKESEIGLFKVSYPLDSQGGSWIIASDRGRHVVLLNGAFNNHKRTPPYRKSRGVMMKESYEFEDIVDFFELYDFVGMEPFTMVILDKEALYEFRWDGYVKHVKQLNKEVHIWSSCTLYDEVQQEKRAALLRDELENVSSKSLESFAKAHLYHNEEAPEGGLKVRLLENLMTISHTQIMKSKGQMRLVHTDLLEDTYENRSI